MSLIYLCYILYCYGGPIVRKDAKVTNFTFYITMKEFIKEPVKKIAIPNCGKQKGR